MNTESKHSAHMWKAYEMDNGDWWVQDEAGEQRAIVPHYDSPGQQSPERDARLIAAAPDLLEACLKAANAFANYMAGRDVDMRSSYATVRAAIEKARGAQ